MRYQIRYSTEATKDIKKLDAIVRKRLDKKLLYYVAQEDPLRYAKPLLEYDDARYRWRIGKYRVLFDVKDDAITVLRVDKRSDVYRMFLF